MKRLVKVRERINGSGCLSVSLSKNHEIGNQQIFQFNRQAAHDLCRERHESPVSTEGLVEDIR